MLEQGKVSIVVPIYNVEKYLHRCVNSILQQTYKHLEIILVNDGSPDNCGKIADDYKKKDARVRVIHKENGGLSDARNHGMELVTGEFTMFVDSDDWLDERMVEVIIHSQLKYKVDVVQSGFFYAYDDKLLIDHRQYETDDPPILLDNNLLMYELVKNKTVKNFAWGKLYKTKLIKDIPFEKGVLFEDVFWSHQVMHQVHTYLIIHKPLAYYYQRDDSIVAAYSPRNLDMIRGLKERHLFIEEFYEDLTNASYKHLFEMCLIHYNLLVLNRKKDRQGKHRRDIKTYIKNNYDVFKVAIKDDKQLVRQFRLFSFHPYINILYLGIRKGLRSLGILSRPPGLKQVKIS